jgi:Domain of unknown function (DUF4158)
MTPWQAVFFGLMQIPRELTAFEIEAFFTFTATERQVIEQRRQPALKLGLALQIGFLRMIGRVLDDVRIVPAVLWRHLGEQFNVAAPDLASLRAMYGRGNTLFEHQQLACEVLDFHWLSEAQRRASSSRRELFTIHPSPQRTARLNGCSISTDAKFWFFAGKRSAENHCLNRLYNRLVFLKPLNNAHTKPFHHLGSRAMVTTHDPIICHVIVVHGCRRMADPQAKALSRSYFRNRVVKIHRCSLQRRRNERSIVISIKWLPRRHTYRSRVD